ncbi:hypothetical protein ES705_42741 [subsurface metagenome]
MPALSASLPALLSPALALALGPRTWLLLGRAATTLARDLRDVAAEVVGLARRGDRSAPSPHQTLDVRDGEKATIEELQDMIMSWEGLAPPSRER